MLSAEDRDLLGLAPELKSARRPSAVSQVLRAIRDDVERGEVTWEVLGKSGGAVEYRILVASTRELRERAYRLAHRVYCRSGYAGLNQDGWCVSPYDAQAQTLTLLIEDFSGQDVATVTLTFDSPSGLPCDEIFGLEIDTLRAQGRKVVEVTRLAMEECHAHSKTLLVCLFNFIYVFARRVRADSDFVIEVNPRHVSYYNRLLLFEVQGSERPCPRVQGAPAVLLRLDLSVPEREGKRVRGAGPQANERSLYPHFYSWLEEGAIAEFLAKRQQPMSEAEARYFRLDQVAPLLEEPLDVFAD